MYLVSLDFHSLPIGERQGSQGSFACWHIDKPGQSKPIQSKLCLIWPYHIMAWLLVEARPSSFLYVLALNFHYLNIQRKQNMLFLCLVLACIVMLWLSRRIQEWPLLPLFCSASPNFIMVWLSRRRPDLSYLALS